MAKIDLENALEKLVAFAVKTLHLLPDEAHELQTALNRKLVRTSSAYVKLTAEEKERRKQLRVAAKSNKPYKYTKLDPREKEQRRLLRLISKSGKAGMSLGRVESWVRHGSNPSLRWEIFCDLRAPAVGSIITWNDAVGRSFFYTPETWKERQDAMPNT
jgi:hypothetical protein